MKPARRVFRLAAVLARVRSVELSCSHDAFVRVLTGEPSLFEKEPPSPAELRSARAELRKLLRRKPTVRSAGRPRGSVRPRPVPDVTEDRLRAYLECCEVAQRFAEYGGLTPREMTKDIVKFLGGPTHATRVAAFMSRNKPDHLVRFLLKLRLGLFERDARRLSPRLRQLAKRLDAQQFPLTTREREFWTAFGMDEAALRRLRQFADEL